MSDHPTDKPSPRDPEKLRLGGMALRNGLLVHGPTHWAAAVRTPAGEVKAASGRKPRVRGAWTDAPGVRGVVRLGESFAVIPLVKRALPEVKLPFQDPSVVGVAVAASVGGGLLRKRAGGRVAGEAASAVLGVVPALFALRGGELAQYHGAEHKAIGAYESGIDAAEEPKEHERCGSHLVAPMLVSNVAGTALLHKALGRRPRPVEGSALALASTAAAVEVFAWCERHPDSVGAKAVRTPGFALQRVLGTREPDERQLEVSDAALQELLRAEAAAA